LMWGFVAQTYITTISQASLKETGIQAERLLVNPTAFNSILWRMVAMTPDYYYEGFRSLLDEHSQITWRRYPRCDALIPDPSDNAGVAAIAKFSHGFYSLGQQEGRLTVTDLRMGQEPYYFFRFEVGQVGRVGEEAGAIVSRAVGQRPDVATALPWLWARLEGKDLPLPAADYAGRSIQEVQLERCGYPNKN
jgi:inner membrane protein